MNNDLERLHSFENRRKLETRIIDSREMNIAGVDKIYQQLKSSLGPGARILFLDNNIFPGATVQTKDAEMEKRPWLKVVDHHGVFSVEKEKLGEETTTAVLLLDSIDTLEEGGWLGEQVTAMTNNGNLDPDGLLSFFITQNPDLARKHRETLKAVSRYTDHWMFGKYNFDNDFNLDSIDEPGEMKQAIKIGWIILEMINKENRRFVQQELNALDDKRISLLVDDISNLDRSSVDGLLSSLGYNLSATDQKQRQETAESLIKDSISTLNTIVSSDPRSIEIIYDQKSTLDSKQRNVLRWLVRLMFNFYGTHEVGQIYDQVVSKIPDVLEHPEKYDNLWQDYLERLKTINEFTKENTTVDDQRRYAVSVYPDRPDNEYLTYDWLAKSSGGYTEDERVRVYIAYSQPDQKALVSLRYPSVEFDLNPLTVALNQAEKDKSNTTGEEAGLWYGRQAVSLPLKKSLLNLEEIRGILEKSWDKIKKTN